MKFSHIIRLSIWFVLIAIIMPLYALTEARKPAGTGTQRDPFLISDLSNLRWLSETREVWGTQDQKKHFLQTADIDASETKYWHGGLGFSPIGVSGEYEVKDIVPSVLFYGYYDGGNHRIANLCILQENQITMRHTGLFGFASHSQISNLHIVDANISGSYNIGTLAGRMHHSKVINCSSSGTITGSASIIGGLIGNALSSEIDRCFSTVSINASFSLALGGLIGFLTNGTSVSDSYFYGSITANSTRKGAIATGGLIGESLESKITNCYVATTQKMENVGGIVGSSYRSKFASCFWDKETTGVSRSYLDIPYPIPWVNWVTAKGINSKEMKTPSTFRGWDFKSVWGIDSHINNGYPYLR
jgi:hypothetical protein